MRSLAPLLLIPLAACFSPPVASPRTTVTQETNVHVAQNIKNKVDILFMVDNSSSMDPMQLELRARFGDFFKLFETLAAAGTFTDLHIGVVTSDFGAGDTAGGGCDASGGGQHGFLQTLPSPNATSPPPNCMPPVGAPYIAYAFDPKGGAATTNLPNGNSEAALVSEFTCMASVGAKGCGFEHQLESVYAALHNTKENADFLRADAILAVVFVTNEDDGSAAPSAKFYEQAGSDPNGGGMYGQYTTYRQTRFAVDCGGMPIPYGMPIPSLTNCAAAPNPMAADLNAAYDISRYVDYFTKEAKLGGVKVDPTNVILVGIDGPETPFATLLVDNTKGNTPYVPCPSPMLSSMCNEALQHSCENNVQPGFFGDPAVRLNAVINLAPNHSISSICGDDLKQTPDFTNALAKVAELISVAIKPGCLNAAVANRSDGTPDCVVEDVTLDPSGGPATTVEIPSCAENGHVTPCWQYNDLLAQYQSQGCLPATEKPPASCTLPQTCQPVTSPLDGKLQLASISIDRGDQVPPKNTTAQVSCATIASSSQ